MYSAWCEFREIVQYRASQLYFKGLSKDLRVSKLRVPVSSGAFLIAAKYNYNNYSQRQQQQQQQQEQLQLQHLQQKQSRLLGQQKNVYCGFVFQCVGNGSLLCDVAKLQKLRTVGLRGMHSTVVNVNLAEFEVRILPALQDNYMYMIVDKKTREGAIVDPVDADLVVETAKKEKVNLKKVLTTHHHWDHNGGNEKLISLWPEPLDVYGYDERINGINHKVNHDDCLQIGDLTVRCIYTPCHTTGHICYYVKSPNNEGVVFTGDTLFQGGCGRFFEGTAEQMYASLCLKLGNLPNDTKVFCGHEYSLQNLTFARHVEPNNEEVVMRLEWIKDKRAALEPTVPSTIEQEKSWNPFMRCQLPSVQDHVCETDKVATMRALRKEKDLFKA